MFRFRWIWLAGCLGGAALVGAQDTVPQGVTNKAAETKADVSMAADRYAGEPAVVERLETQYRYAADGTGSRQMTMVLRLMSEATVRQFGVVTTPFASSTEHVEFDYIRVRRPDGSVVETPVSDAQEMPTEVTREAPFYSDLKEKQVPVRSLRVGDRLEYRVRVVRTKAEAPGQFWGEHRMVESAVVLAESMELRVPKGEEVTVWSPLSKPVVTEEGGEKVYRWTSSLPDATVGKEADAKKEAEKKRTLTESEQQDRTLGKFPLVAWTTFKSWEQVGAWYRGLEADRVVADADVKAKVTELTAGKKTDAEKMQVLYDYVATQIRYIGVDLGVGRYQPHAAGEVLRNQYGDCKDKHTLLAAMLGAAGVRSDAVLVGANVRFNAEVPSPGAFNHVITAVPQNGETIWLDATQEVAPYRVLLAMLRDKQVLVVPATGEAKVERTPKGLPFTPFGRFEAKAVLDKNGTVTSQIAMTFRGDDEVVMRSLLRQISPGQYNDFVQRFSQGLGFGGTTSHAEVSRPEVTAEPFRIAYDYSRDKPGDWANYRMIPQLPPVYLPMVDEKNPPQVPIELGMKHVETATTEMKLPEGWGVTLPDGVHVHTAFLNFDKTYRFEHGTLYADRKIEVLEEKIPAAEWKAYKKFADDASLQDGETFIQLTSTEKKAGEAGPPAPSVNNDEAERLVMEAANAMQARNFDQARSDLDAAKKANDKQLRLWGAYGYLAFMQGEVTEAIGDYKKEIALHPDETLVYLPLATAQQSMGKIADAEETLKMRLVQAPDVTTSMALASMLRDEGKEADAAKILETADEKEPGNKRLRLTMGTDEMKAGRKQEGSKVLVALLNETDDAGMQNDASYALADGDMELELAEKNSLKSVETQTKESAALTVEDDWMMKAGKARLLVAAWDTMGWVYFREHKLDEAESYLRAAWLCSAESESGLHLGELEEAQGRLSEALATYEMARTNAISYGADGVRRPPTALALDLDHRAERLKRRGIKAKYRKPGDAAAELQGLRKLTLGAAEGRSGTAEYTVLLTNGRVEAVKEKDPGKTLRDGNSMVKRAVVETWSPKGSEAKMLRQGILNCHAGVCEFVVVPM